MPTDGTTAAANEGPTDGGVHDLETARAALIAAIDGAEPERENETPAEPDGLAKVDGNGLSFELRLNGQTIALDGKDVNELAPNDFKPFLDRQKRAVESGEFDGSIADALEKDGPGKALARVRAIGSAVQADQ